MAPGDPLAAAMLTHPELFDFETSAWTVDTEPATAGRVIPSGARSIDIVRHVDERALTLIVGRIAASVRGAEVTRAGSDAPSQS